MKPLLECVRTLDVGGEDVDDEDDCDGDEGELEGEYNRRQRVVGSTWCWSD